MDKKMKDFICVAIAFITTIASLQFYIIEGESSHSSVNFINPGDNTYNYLEDEIIDFFRSEDLTEVERRIDTPNDDLRLVRFLLHDGTEEIRLFNEAVKYVDDIGQVHTKSLTLFEIDNYGKYRYSNRKNDIAMRFGNTFTDGIALNYKNYEIEIYPIKANETRAQISPDAKSICYNEAFSAQTRVEYIAEYSGLKETIVLEEDEEINTFSFVIATELSLKLEDGIVRAFDNNNNCVGNFGSVAVTDMAHNETSGFITINRINDARYLFTVTVPMEYLASEETVYPVAIDPTFYFNQYSYNFAGYKQIYDVTLYSTGNCYSPNAEVLTVNGMPYSGYSRVLIKFPNILTILNKIGADNLLGVYYAYNGLTNSTNSVVIKPMGVNWSTSATSLTPSEYSALFNGALSTQQINDTIHYGPGILNITAIAEDWMHSVYPNRGIMIECINTSGYNNIPSVEYTVSSYYRPYIQIKYSHQETVDGPNPLTGLFKIMPFDSGGLVSAYAMKNSNSIVTTNVTTNVYNSDQLLYVSWNSLGYTIQNPYNDYYLTSIVTSNPENCVLYFSPTCTSGSFWSFVENSTGMYYIVGTTQEQICCYMPNYVNSGITIVSLPEGIATNQANTWTLKRQIDSIPFKIKNVSSQKYLTVENAYDKDGQNIFQRPLYSSLDIADYNSPDNPSLINYYPSFGSQTVRVIYDNANLCYRLNTIASKNGRLRTISWDNTGNAIQFDPMSENMLSITISSNGQATIRQKTGAKLALSVVANDDGVEGNSGKSISHPGNIIFSAYNSGDSRQKWVFELDYNHFREEAYYSQAGASYPLHNSGLTPDIHLQINSDYGARALSGNTLPHDGIDLCAYQGTDVYSAVYGTVVDVRKTLDPNAQDSRGLYILIRSNSINKYGTNTRICMFVQHLDSVSSSINFGTTVTPSTVIGTVGYSGLGAPSYTHLHYGFCLESDFESEMNSSNHFERCLFVDSLMFHNNMVFYEAINGLSRFLLPVT